MRTSGGGKIAKHVLRRNDEIKDIVRIEEAASQALSKSLKRCTNIRSCFFQQLANHYEARDHLSSLTCS